MADVCATSATPTTDPTTKTGVFRDWRGQASWGRVCAAVALGMAGVLMTRGMPGGVHVRLIAPFDWRVKNLAKNDGLNEAAAYEKVKLLDKDREAFVAKYWPRLPNHDDVFHLTLNASLLTEEQMADCVLPLIGTAVSRVTTV